MIVRNEEGNLRDCLTPIAGFFDEIVIVDTGSTDGTRELAREFTPHVFEFAWCDDFAAARNETLRYAHGEWIFWLDADDRILPIEVPKLRALLRGLGLEREAYLINTTCRPQYSCDGAPQLSHYRLFRRDPRLQWRGRVHEQLRPEPQNLGYQICSHALRIQHLGYSDGALQIKKAQRNIRLLRMDFAADPEDVSTIVHLAMAYARAYNYREAMNYLQMLAPRMRTREDWQRGVYKLLVEISVKTESFDDALRYARQGFLAFPDEKTLLFSQAEVLYEIDRYDECIRTLAKLERMPETRVAHGLSLGEIRVKWAPLLLAEACRESGQIKPALKVLKSLLERYPRDVRVLHSLGLTYLRAGLRERLPSLRRKLETEPNGDVFSLLLAVVDGLMFNSLEGLDEIFERLISLAPQMPRARILRVEYLGRIHAPLEAYLSACRDALRLCPGHNGIRQHVTQIEQFLSLQTIA
jgi:glycosyltransferase involved in cell wall biosynthesis